MKMLIVPTSDWIRHPIPSRLHFIFEELAIKNDVHVIHFENTRWNIVRDTNVILHKTNGFPVKDLALYYALNSLFHYKTINEVLKEEDIDVVIFSHILAGASSIISSRRYKIPVVCDYLDHFPESASIYYDNKILKTIVGGAVEKITSWNLYNSDRIVTVSTNFKNMLDKMGCKRISIIPNGVDTELFKPYDKYECLDIINMSKLKNKLIICYVGSIEKWVDLDGIIKAVNRLNNMGRETVFLLVGGSIAGKYHEEIMRNTEYIVSTGFVDYKMVPFYIGASDVCVLPLKPMKKNLTTPLKILQYFACGKPVFTLPNAEVEARFGDSTFIYNNSDELVRGILELEGNFEEYNKKTSKGQKYGQQYSWDVIRRDYFDLLRELVSR